MRYVQRGRDGVVVAHFANAQSYAMELLPDDHPDIVEFKATRKAREDESRARFSVGALEARISAQDAQIAALTARIEELERKTALLP